MKFKDLLIELDACEGAVEWVGDRTWGQAYNECPRGDWLLWLFARTNPDNIRELTLAKGHCTNTVRHLMKDKRSVKAIDTAIAYGEGKATKDELDAASHAAHAAYATTNTDKASANAVYAVNTFRAYAAAYAAANAAAHAANAAYAAYAAYAAAYAAARAAAKQENQQQTADICRKYLPIGLWNIKEQEK